MNIEKVKEFMQLGLGMALATADDQNRPEIADVFGLGFCEQNNQVLLYINSTDCRTCLLNIEKNPRVALSLSEPRSNLAIQLKGKILQVLPMTDGDQKLAADWLALYKVELSILGLGEPIQQGLNYKTDFALHFEISEIFEQSPGSKAGQFMGNL